MLVCTLFGRTYTEPRELEILRICTI